MASQIASIGADDEESVSSTSGPHTPRNRDRSGANDVAREIANNSEGEVSSSSYILANDLSQLSGDVDRWIAGSVSSNRESTGVQGSRQRVMQRSTVTSSCMASDTMWYALAMIMPMLSIHNCVMTLRCTPSNILNTAEIFIHNVGRMFSKAKLQVQRIAREQTARDLFAAAMDVLLVIYALGFLVLSMYQASIIG